MPAPPAPPAPMLTPATSSPTTRQYKLARFPCHVCGATYSITYMRTVRRPMHGKTPVACAPNVRSKATLEREFPETARVAFAPTSRLCLKACASLCDLAVRRHVFIRPRKRRDSTVPDATKCHVCGTRVSKQYSRAIEQSYRKTATPSDVFVENDQATVNATLAVKRKKENLMVPFADDSLICELCSPMFPVVVRRAAPVARSPDGLCGRCKTRKRMNRGNICRVCTFPKLTRTCATCGETKLASLWVRSRDAGSATHDCSACYYRRYRRERRAL